MTIFSNYGVFPKIIHHFAVENAQKQLNTNYHPQQSLSNSSRSVVKIEPPYNRSGHPLQLCAMLRREPQPLGMHIAKLPWIGSSGQLFRPPGMHISLAGAVAGDLKTALSNIYEDVDP